MRLQDLTPLLEPRSLVIVGASSNANRTGGIPLDNLLSGGFDRDRLLLVNPKYPQIRGIACHASIADLPFAPDLAVLAVRAAEVLPALRQCAAKGVRAAAVFASGFAEEGSADGRRLQAELGDFVRDSGMVVSGPNCLGHVNLRLGVYATFLKRPPESALPGPVAVLAQSGNMAAVLWRAGRDHGLGFSYLINTGNEACTELAEYLEFLADDPHTGAVLAYVEQVRDGPRFLAAAARLRAQGKPLFVLKSGSSDKGAEAAASHTAAMAGSQSAYEAAFAQIGAACATDPTRLVDLARLWQGARRTAVRASRGRVCVVSVSGAGCALLADQFSRLGTEVPTLGEPTRHALRQVVPRYGMVTNPVDLTGQVTNDAGFFPAVIDAILAEPAVDAVVFYVMGYLLDLLAPHLLRVAATAGKLLVVIDTAAGAASHGALEAAGVTVFDDMDRAVHATARFLAWSGDVRAGTADWQPALASTGVTAPEGVLARSQHRSLLTEVEAKSLLARAGLPMVREVVARTADEAAALSVGLVFPVAVKVLSPHIAHKSDVGGVQLNLIDPPQVRIAFGQVTGNARAAFPEAVIEGVVIQPMVTQGQPVLIGIVRDAVFGPMMTVGLGGVLTELYQDVARRVLPVDRRQAESMLRELKSFPLLDGFRGAPVADREALVDLMVELSRFMLDQGGDIAELELNPVLVCPLERRQADPHCVGAVAVDALIRLIPD